MGLDFLLKKSEREKLCRVRSRFEKFGAHPGLEAVLTPARLSRHIRCEIVSIKPPGNDGNPPVNKGDKLLLVPVDNEVRVLKGGSTVGRMIVPEDFRSNTGSQESPDCHYVQAVSAPSELDGTFDVSEPPGSMN